jgi:hypothetical protein
MYEIISIVLISAGGLLIVGVFWLSLNNIE